MNKLFQHFLVFVLYTKYFTFVELMKKDQLSSLEEARIITDEMKENWKVFIAKSTAKSKSHSAAARYWNKVNKTLFVFLVILGVAATFLALLPNIPRMYVAGLAAAFTLIACVLAFLRPAEKRQIHLRTSREFQSQMLRMVRCKTYFEYDELWQDYNKNVFEEPFLPKRHRFPVDTTDIQWSMTPELSRAILNKKEELKKQTKLYMNRSVGTTTDTVNIEQNSYFNTGSLSYAPAVNYFANNKQNMYAVTARNAASHQNVLETTTGMHQTGDEAFEVVVSEQSSQGIAIFDQSGKQKKKQTFQQLKRSQTTSN